MKRQHRQLTAIVFALGLAMAGQSAMASEIERGEAVYLGLRFTSSNIGEPDRQAPLFVRESGGGLEFIFLLSRCVVAHYSPT